MDASVQGNHIVWYNFCISVCFSFNDSLNIQLECGLAIRKMAEILTTTSESAVMTSTGSPPPQLNWTFNNIDEDDSRTLDGLDYTILSLLLMISVGIGVFYAWKDRKDTGTDGFLMGDRSMSLWPSSFSMVATFISSTVIIGFPLEVYIHGTQVYLVSLGLIFASVVAAEVFIPVLYRLQVTSVNEYLYKRFQSNAVRIAASVIFIITLVRNRS